MLYQILLFVSYTKIIIIIGQLLENDNFVIALYVHKILNFNSRI